MNYEFARPVTSSQQHTNQLDPELFPHAYNIIKDAQTGRRDGILKRPRTDPLIFHTQTSTEYWQKRGCLGHTDGRGNDLKLPDNVRLYVIASAQHNSPFGSEPAKDDSQFLVNPLPAGDVLRALMVAMDLCGDKRHPAAAKPLSQREGSHIGCRRLVTAFRTFPALTSSACTTASCFSTTAKTFCAARRQFIRRDLVARPYEILVPKVDADGNDIAGIRLPAVQVPVGTYTGWNLRPRGLAEGELSGLLGSFIPFAKTKAQRRKTRDPRLSLEERYQNRADYVQRVSRAARILVEQRFCCRKMPRGLSQKQERSGSRKRRCQSGGSHVVSLAAQLLTSRTSSTSPKHLRMSAAGSNTQ